MSFDEYDPPPLYQKAITIKQSTKLVLKFFQRSAAIIHEK